MYEKSERELRQVPAESRRVPPRAVARGGSIATQGTLDLPFQGVRESFFNISLPHLPQQDVKRNLEAPDLKGHDLKGHDSERTLQTDFEEVCDVKDLV